jgi:hypothetical protein
MRWRATTNHSGQPVHKMSLVQIETAHEQPWQCHYKSVSHPRYLGGDPIFVESLNYNQDQKRHQGSYRSELEPDSRLPATDTKSKFAPRTGQGNTNLFEKCNDGVLGHCKVEITWDENEGKIGA